VDRGEGSRAAHRAIGVAAAAALALAGRPDPPASDAPGVAAISWQAPAVVASGAAIRGPWRQNESEFDWVDDPAVAVDPRGGLAIAWVDQGRRDVLLQLLDPRGRPRLAAPVDVSRTPAAFSWLPRVAFLEGGAVAVLWQEIVFSGGSHGGEILAARSTDGGRAFGPPWNLSRSVAGDGKGRLDARTWDNGSLDLAAVGRDRLHAAWTEYEGALRVSRSTDGGASFSPPLRIEGTGEARPARGPSLAARGDTVWIAFTFGEDPAADVHVARSRDGGRSFGPPHAVARTRGHSDAPRIAVDPRGAVHVVFGERDGPGRPSRVWTARAEPGTLDFGPPRAVHGVRGGGEGAAFPDLAVAGDGALWVMSELFRPGDDGPRGLQLSVSRDGGRTFSSPAVVPGTADRRGTGGGQQGRFMRRLAVTRAGELAIAYGTFERGVASEIVLLRGTPR
jgi:hypothetical protein